MVWSFERAEADIAQLSEQALDKDDFCWAAGERIAQAVHFDASCWHTHDPATLLITSHITGRLPFCRFELLAHNEYAADDVNLFTELAPAAGECERCAVRRGTGPTGASATASCSSPMALTQNSVPPSSTADPAGVD